MVILISLLTVVSTLLGGLFALRFKDKLHLILGFSAGAVIGVALFDLLPEAMQLGGAAHSIQFVATIIGVGFGLFLVIDRAVSIHSHCQEEDCHNANHKAGVGALTLSIHSFLDGLGIGLAFQISPTVGAIVTAAVLAHDFSDGINTVNVILKNDGNSRAALRWLLLDAVAPAAGAASTLLFKLDSAVLGIILALFTGFFLYLGASDILPESHHDHPTAWTTISTILGALVIYLAVHLAG